MSNHQTWHDQQGQYSGPPPQRHHPNMDPYQSHSPSSQQGHGSNYPQAHLPPPVVRQQPQQQQWIPQSGASQDFGGPSPSNPNSRSSGPYNSGFDASPSSGIGNSPMRQHGTSPYASQSSYAPLQPHGPSESQMHPGVRGGMPSQHDYTANHGPGGGYSHHHHSQPQYQQGQQQQQQGPPQQHHPLGHPSQQQHWNNNNSNNSSTHLPSVLQPQSLLPPPGSSGTRTPGAGGASSNSMDRAYGGMGAKQEDDMDDDDAGAYDDYDAKGKTRGGDGAHLTNKGTSDFVKKLFSMLDDTAYESVVAWSPTGDSFVVKDMNDFTKHVLPRNFRHSNFASFVRQLNKYDFHKVKNPEDGSGAVGEHVWEFQHPDFVRGREDLLENVKRKIPAKKKPNAKGGLLDGDRDDSPSMAPPMVEPHGKLPEPDADLRMQVAHLTAVQDQMQNHILALTKQYQGVIGEMLTFQRNMVQQDQLMQNLIQYLMNLEQDRRVEIGPDQPSASSFMAQTSGHKGNTSNTGPFLPPAGPGSYDSASAAPFMNNHNNHNNHNNNNNNSSGSGSSALKATGSGAHSGGPSGTSAETGSNTTHAGSSTRMSNMTTAPSTVGPLSPKSVASPLDGNNAKTPEVTNSMSSIAMHPPHLDDTGRRASGLSSLRMFNGDTRNGSALSSSNLPKLESAYDRDEGDRSSQPASVEPNSTGSAAAAKNSSKHLRPRRPTLVPGWTAPPRVLLVDDDEVCRRLSSKFLQVFGCQIEYAVDGMSAVSKMNASSYDLVLMDIVMPNLDGMSATSLIRQFDKSTPIISMTSNSGPSELMNYMSMGMTDMLPKPFTKEGLLQMLEKHLLHLKAAQREHRTASTDAGMASGDGAIKRSTDAAQPASASAPTGSSGGVGGGDGETSITTLPATAAEGDGVNPLAGMGFTDEEYVAMLQNLIAAGTGDDELAKALFGNDSFAPDGSAGPNNFDASTANPTMAPGGFKRTISTDDAARGTMQGGRTGDSKRGRFDMA